MKFRPYAVAAALAVATLEIGVVAPAHAAVPDPVTDVSAVSQAQGSGQSWTVGISWTASANADAYRVAITDQADGTNTAGSYYASKDVTGTSASLNSASLVTGHTYWVAVRSLNGSDVGTAVTDDFVAMTLDTTGPTGTFKLDHTKDYIGVPFFRVAMPPVWTDTVIGESEDEESEVGFAVTQTALSDDTTPAAQITRKVRRDTGEAAVTWTSGRAILVYGKAGTYHPEVVLTDQFGNSSTIALPAITVTLDAYGPTVRITRPGPARIGKVAGWRYVHGRVFDSQSGPAMVLTMVVEKRGSIWYAYDFRKRTWLKGFRSLDKTFEETDASPAFAEPNGTFWRTPRISGLTAGVLHIETVGFDNAFNLAIGPTVHRKITR